MPPTDDDKQPTNQPDTTKSSQRQESILASAVSNIHLDEPTSTPSTSSSSTQPIQDASQPRPLIIYSRIQMLALSKSPLVKPPDGMPPFKTWYGEPNDQALSSNKKDTDPTPSNVAARNSRYRREAEDGDAPSRPSFRSTLSQPSQMGNFKHQPLRADRDRDRDRETETHLRTLSDKYDRERGRIGAPSHSTLLRNRDRDSAPHLASGREGGKKRTGESNEDWRRGAEPLRGSRDEQHTRRDRDDRDRARSRARDSSRQRESPHSSRRERDERGERKERERDDNRSHDFMRKDRDRERFVDEEDTRRWRDDGKRDERVPQKREKDRLDRGEHSRERTDDDRDHDTWRNTDETRGQKRGPRERRIGGGVTDSRDREDRREREKEKEPAWMETYIPPASGGGILGGKGFGGEIDSIQAWKKDMKEREMKAKGVSVDATDSTTTRPSTNDTQPRDSTNPPSTSFVPPEGQQLDEIQLFKLMMKQAKADAPSEDRPPSSGASPHGPENGISGLMRIRGVRQATPSAPAEASTTILSEEAPINVQSELVPSAQAPALSNATSTSDFIDSAGSRKTPSNATEDSLARVLLAKTAVPIETKPSVPPTTTTLVPPFEPPRQSRLLALGAQSSKLLHTPSLPTVVQAPPPSQQPMETLLWNGQLPAVTPAFPAQQGVLEKPVATPAARRQLDMSNQMLQGMETNSGPRVASRESGTFVQYDPTSRLAMDAVRDVSGFSGVDVSRTSSAGHPLAPERNVAYGAEGFHQIPEGRNGVPTPPLGGYNSGPMTPFDNAPAAAPSYASGKGSRMAKHFERSRENQITNIVRTHAGNTSGTPLIGRQDSPVFTGPQIGAGGAEQRNITDLLAMLNSSAQAQVQRNQLPGHVAQSAMAAQVQQQMQLHGGPPNALRHEILLDPEDRFVADGLVPGLRPAPAPRSREANNSGMFGGPDDMQFMQRIPPQRGLEQMYGGPISPQFTQQGPGVGRGYQGLQQAPIRGGPSPISNFNPIQGQPQQRLPPGLANLGARPPPHESQFVSGGGGLGIASQAILGGLQQPGNGPQGLAQFHGGLGVVGNQPHLRAPPVGMGNMGGGGLNGLAGPSGLDFRGQFVPPQNQMVNLGGPGVGGMRGMPGFNAQNVHGLGGNIGSGPTLGLRQQPPQQAQNQAQGPQHHLQGPHMLQQMLPGQVQQHGFPGGQHNQTDLMALLMGGAHRE